jgi:acyl-coenzyme A thioesterase PaaI-like protein
MLDASHSARLKGMQHEYHPRCAICAPQNPAGFGLDFRLLDGHAVEASFSCDERFQGYRNWLHGGAIAAILDGAMTNCLFARGLVAVTADLRVRFRQPLPTGSEATVRAWVERSLGPLHTLAAEIVQGGRVAASASGTFMEYSPQRLGTPAREPGNLDPVAMSMRPHLVPTPATGAGPAPGPGGDVTGHGCRQAPMARRETP